MSSDPVIAATVIVIFVAVAIVFAMPGVFVVSYIWSMGNREKAIWVRMESDLRSERKERARLQILVDRLLFQLRESGIVPDSDSLYITDGELVYLQIDQHFSEPELSELAHRLGFEIENIAGSTKREKALNLSLHMERRNKTEELMDQLKIMRPAITW